jgi:hypothetical protein
LNKKTYQEVNKKGRLTSKLFQQSLILIGGDGASWIKERAKKYFP